MLNPTLRLGGAPLYRGTLARLGRERGARPRVSPRRRAVHAMRLPPGAGVVGVVLQTFGGPGRGAFSGGISPTWTGDRTTAINPSLGMGHRLFGRGRLAARPGEGPLS